MKLPKKKYQKKKIFDLINNNNNNWKLESKLQEEIIEKKMKLK